MINFFITSASSCATFLFFSSLTDSEAAVSPVALLRPTPSSNTLDGPRGCGGPAERSSSRRIPPLSPVDFILSAPLFGRSPSPSMRIASFATTAESAVSSSAIPLPFSLLWPDRSPLDGARRIPPSASVLFVLCAEEAASTFAGRFGAVIFALAPTVLPWAAFVAVEAPRPCAVSCDLSASRASRSPGKDSAVAPWCSCPLIHIIVPVLICFLLYSLCSFPKPIGPSMPPLVAWVFNTAVISRAIGVCECGGKYRRACAGHHSQARSSTMSFCGIRSSIDEPVSRCTYPFSNTFRAARDAIREPQMTGYLDKP